MEVIRNTIFAAVLALMPLAASGQDFDARWAAYERGDFDVALKEWRPLAEHGDADAQFNLGMMYDNGQGVPQDNAEAMRWFRLAAKQGVALAQYYLGRMYAYGQGVPQDHAEAVRWYRLAAEQGDADAQSNLGVMYGFGQGVPQDYVTAHMWFNSAAADGVSGAADNRDFAASKMTAADISEAQRRAGVCLKSGYSDCD